MYNKYFGFNEAPFSIAPNPRYLFMSARHREALAHLLYGVGQGGGFVLLTGEVGTGKTTVSRCLLDQLPDNTDVALILNPYLNANSLLATICDELGIEGADENQSLKQLTDKLYAFLLENHSKGRHTVLLIDEAQHLKFDVLEQIRLLTNLETNTKKLLQIVFIGQPELNELLAQADLRQLAQRITARFHIQPLTLEETQSYIVHRLHVAGLPKRNKIFPPEIIKKIYTATDGIPRLINVLCDRILLGTYAQNKEQADDNTFRQALNEVRGSEQGIKPKKRRWPIAAGLAATVCAGATLWWSWPHLQGLLPTQQATATTVLTQAPPTASGQVERQTDTLPAVPDTLAPPVVNNLHNVDLSRLPTDASLALGQLLTQLNILPTPGLTPCDNIIALGYRCEKTSATGWQEFRDINRPAVLTLTDAQGNSRYVPIIAMNGNQVAILQSNNTLDVNLIDLGNNWNGNFTFIWAAPLVYERPVAFGDRSPFVKWLADAFAKIDNQPQGLSGEKFNTSLAARVKLFQRDHQLKDDGIVGVNTLLKVNEQLGTAKTLNSQTMAAQAQPANHGQGG